MRIQNQFSHGLLILLSTALFISCNKQNDWLSVKTNKTDLIPSKLSDYQALLDASDIYMNIDYPFLGQQGCDDYWSTYANWQSTTTFQRNAYIWAADIFAGGQSNDWNEPYVLIEYANVCLEGIQNITRDSSNRASWDNIKGTALFFRGQSYFNLAKEFAPAYDPATAGIDLGVPLRNSSDVNIRSTRSSVAETYQQMISDLKEAENILPLNPAITTRPSVAAAQGLLARIYLNMGDYPNAWAYADKALKQSGYLLDFNTLNTSLTYPLPTYQGNNKEILFYAATGFSSFHITNGIIDSVLYQSYPNNDLRKTIFFKNVTGGVGFRGQYTGSAYPFGGIANNELYLIRAEALARQGNISAAMTDLNTLLIKRWKTGSFIPISASTSVDALNKILIERRKELVFSGTSRWDDLRRLNKDPIFARTLIRVLNGQPYTLAPNDPKYVLPIPDNEILLSGIQQNPR